MLPNRNAPGRSLRRKRSKGAEIIEFTFVFLPMMIMILVLLDVAWAVFAKATLSYAVRTGLRYGITVTGTQATAASSDLCAMTKARVQANALGLLRGSTGLAKIKVHFWQPPAPNSGTNPTLVDAQADANKPLNIMQVSIEGFTLSPLVPRLFSWRDLDTSSTSIAATSYDLIEPSRDVPPKGTAP
jgi:Flp pilus assembly protein TadG